MLGHLTAEERGAGLPAALGHPADDRGRDLGIEPAHREVVEEEERIGALRGDVVGRADEVDADGVVPPRGPCDHGLRADTVGRGDEDRVVVLQRLEVEEATEPADAAEDAGAVGRAGVGLDELDRVLAGRDVDPRVGVGQARSRSDAVSLTRAAS